MQKKLPKLLQGMLFLALFLTASVSWGQTNPTAQTLPFSFDALGTSTLPAGMAAHRFGTSSGAIPTTRTTIVANGNLGNNAGDNSGGWRNEGDKGVSMLASGSQAAGAIVVALKTTGKENIIIKWKAGTITQVASRDNSVALQYRVGTSDNWTNVGDSVYTSTGKDAGHFSELLTETLPANANNKAVVQVRWIYWESNGTTGSRDRIAIDDISITGTEIASAPTVTTTALANGTTVNTTSAIVPGGNVTANNGSTVSSRGIVWGTATDPTTDNNVVAASAGGTGAYTVDAITGLTPNTRYYYRAYAINTTGTGYGATSTFVTKANTPGAPVADAGNIAVNQLSIAINENGNNNTVVYSIRVNGTAYVQTNGTVGTTEALETAETWGTKTITGLTAGTQYTFVSRARTISTGGGVGVSTFTDFGPETVVSTLPATSPTLTVGTTNLAFGSICTNATSTGSFTFTPTNLTANATIVVDALAGFSYALTETGTYTATLSISNLTNGTPATVWVRFTPTTQENYSSNIVLNGLGDNSSAQLTIIATGTGVNTPGAVSTGTATTVTTITASLSGSAIAGCTAFTSYGIEYSTVADFSGNVTQAPASNLSDTNFSLTLNYLTPNTTYFYKAYANDGAGIHYGTVLSFTTTSLTTPVATAATNVAQTSFTANWNAVTGADSYRLDVSTNPNFATGLASDLFFSEYVEGTSNNKVLEIYNGTGQTVDLSAYSIFRPEATINTPLTLSGTLSHGQTYVIANSQAAPAALAVANRTVTYAENQSISFTGANGPVLLQKNNVTIDYIAGSGLADRTLVRNTNVTSPSTSYIAAQWTRYPIDTVDDLGQHAYNFTPVFLTGYENKTVTRTSETITDLDPYTNYYYRVRAYSPASTTGNSNVTSVTTKPAAVTWTGTPAAWTPAVAIDNTIDAVIDADYNTGANGIFTAKNVILNAQKIFTVTTGTTLTVQESIINNAGVDNFIVQNNAAILQNSATANASAITVIKNSNPLYRLDYTLWSSPVSGQTVGDFSPQTTTGRFYEYKFGYSATANDGAGGDVEQYFIVAPTTPFDAAKGYLIRMPNGNSALPGYNTGEVSDSFKGTFKGVPHNGPVTTVASTNGSRFTAVGNPYPSPINLAAFLGANSSVINASSGLYFWRKKNNGDVSSYATLTLAAYTANAGYGSNPVEGGDPVGNSGYFNGPESSWVISQGQGFLVQTAESPESTTITFENTMRRPVAVSGDQAFFRNAASTRSRVWLNLNDSNNGFSQIAIAYIDNATTGLDYGYDGKMLNDGGSVALYSLAANTNLAIQARPAFTTNDVVPMGFNAVTAGQYTISIDHKDGLFNQGQDIYLKDNFVGTINSLDNAYTFTSTAGTFNNRFEVVYTSEALDTNSPEINASSVIVFKEGNTISINTGSTPMTSVTVYDINGRTLYTKTTDAVSTTISDLQVSKQVLIIEVNTVKGKLSKRIVF